MTQQRHRVWEVSIGRLCDEKLRDRVYNADGRWLNVFRMPTVAKYVIEAKGAGKRAEKRALKLARADGIYDPVVLTVKDVETKQGYVTLKYPRPESH